ncbi:MAG: hypothetical protein ABIE84_07090 [bacterium]
MALLFGIFNRAIARNPYPARFRSPGNKTASLEHLTPIRGVQASIVHALTWHEMPSEIDDKISQLLGIQNLGDHSQIQKDYLSFTVYSLKQMIGAGTISADTAWTLFFEEYEHLAVVVEDTFVGMRRAFLGRTLELLEHEFGASRLEALVNENCRNKEGFFDVRQFEFLLRAGEAGLAQYERYQKWSEAFTFNEEFGENVSEPLREEYKKALWLEMRTIESQLGQPSFNLDVEQFTLHRSVGRYVAGSKKGVVGSVDLFQSSWSKQSGGSIDSTIKAEIGHWYFDLFCLPQNEWVSELMDRMNLAAFTSRINAVFDESDLNLLPPESQAFLSGGYFLSCRGLELRTFNDIADQVKDPEALYPIYPGELPGNYEGLIGQPHVTAERVERKVRKSVINAFFAQNLEVEKVYQFYRRLGFFFSLRNLSWAIDKGNSESETSGLAELAIVTQTQVEEMANQSFDLLQQGLRQVYLSGYSAVKIAAAERSIVCGDASALSVLEEELKTGNTDASLLAITSIGRLNRADGYAILLDFINHSSYSPATTVAAEVLGEGNYVEGVRALANIWNHHREAYVRTGVKCSLGQIVKKTDGPTRKLAQETLDKIVRKEQVTRRRSTMNRWQRLIDYTVELFTTHR